MVLDLRMELVRIFKEKEIPCERVELKPYHDTIWKINQKKAYITYSNDSLPWLQVPATVIDQVDILIFVTKDDSGNLPKPFLISTEDFRISGNKLGEAPVNGRYYIKILSFKWPYIDMRISLGDNSPSVSAPSAGNTDDIDMKLVFDTFELLESEHDQQNITEALRHIENTLKG